MINKFLIKKFLPLIDDFLPVLDEKLIKFKKEKLDIYASEGEEIEVMITVYKNKLFVVFPVIKNNEIIRLHEIENHGKMILLTELIQQIVNTAKNGY